MIIRPRRRWFDPRYCNLLAGITAGGASVGDPYFGSVISLSHFDGANGATTYTDQIVSRTWTNVTGAAALDTGQKKFGTAALKLPGTSNNHVDSDADAIDWAFGTGDFTIEFWFRIGTLGTITLWDQRTALTQPRPCIFLQSGTLLYFVNNATRITGGNLTAATWQHIALSRVSGSTRMFIGGTQTGSTYADSTNYTAGRVSLGTSGDSPGFGTHAGAYDDIRVTKGVGRYTSNFTPPVAAFKNFGIDQHYGKVVSLLHMNGTNGSTVFTDRRDNVWTAGGTAAISTAESKFGGASLGDPTTASRISTPSHAKFGYGTGDFTIEFWFRPTSFTGSAQGIYDQRTSSGQPRPCLFTAASGDLLYSHSGTTRITAPAGTLVLNTWGHIALSRVSGVTKLFKDGTQVGSNYTDVTNYEASGIMIGNFGDQPTNSFGAVGYFDDVRVTKGVGRYTSNFTPPASAFPDS